VEKADEKWSRLIEYAKSSLHATMADDHHITFPGRFVVDRPKQQFFSQFLLLSEIRGI
jgi:hypothetical protein